MAIKEYSLVKTERNYIASGSLKNKRLKKKIIIPTLIYLP